MKRTFVTLAAATFAACRLASAQSATAPASAPSAISTPAPVERATDDAVARLFARIAAERIEGLPISDILNRVDGKQAVLEGLSRAPQIGGPRVIGDGVVQVNLEIRGTLAADLILQAVRAAPERSPISARRIAVALAAWSDRSFSSTGDSSESGHVGPMVQIQSVMPAARVQHVTLPDVPPAWTQDAQTAQAVVASKDSPLLTARAAERAARAALHDQLSKLPLDDKSTLGSASSETAAAIDLVTGAARIASVDYRADGSVEVHVSIDGQQLWQTLQMTVGPEVTTPANSPRSK